MNFFKRIFTKNKSSESETKVNEIFTNEYFDNRYKELDFDNPLFKDSTTMIAGYFQVNNITMKNSEFTNHPVNLDQVLNEGFYEFCKSLGMEDKQIGMTLSICFSNHFIENLDFKLYRDNKPESSLRFLALKYNKDGVVMSLYPFEYTLKVLNNEATYENLYLRTQSQLDRLPKKDDVINQWINDAKNIKN